MLFFRIFTFFFFLCGCLLTHKQATEEAQEAVYQKIRSDQKLDNKELSKVKERIDFLERNSINKTEFDLSLEGLREKIQFLQQQLQIVQTEQKNTSQIKNTNRNKNNVKQSSDNLFQTAQQYFKDQKWKQAIFSYEEFRKKEKKSPNIPRATLNIGISFLKLNLNKDAVFFLQEVLSRYPQSEEAKLAKIFLNQIKE